MVAASPTAGLAISAAKMRLSHTPLLYALIALTATYIGIAGLEYSGLFGQLYEFISDAFADRSGTTSPNRMKKNCGPSPEANTSISSPVYT